MGPVSGELRCIGSHTDHFDEQAETPEGQVAACTHCHQLVPLVSHLLRTKRDTLILDNHKR